MNNIIITDSSLRDGNHSVKHTIGLKSIKKYCEFANKVNIPIVEVGHGNGIGASSLLIGKSTHTDKEIITTAKKYLTNSKLGIHAIPGIATVDKDIKPAIDMGVNVVRVATHCTEATLSKSHLEYLQNTDASTLPSIISINAGSFPLPLKNLGIPLPHWFLCCSNKLS